MSHAAKVLAYAVWAQARTGNSMRLAQLVPVDVMMTPSCFEMTPSFLCSGDVLSTNHRRHSFPPFPLCQLEVPAKSASLYMADILPHQTGTRRACAFLPTHIGWPLGSASATASRLSSARLAFGNAALGEARSRPSSECGDGDSAKHMRRSTHIAFCRLQVHSIVLGWAE